MLGQRVSIENMDGGITTIFMTSVSAANSNNKHRATIVRKSFFVFSKKKKEN